MTEQLRYLELSAKLHQITLEYGDSDACIAMLVTVLDRLNSGVVEPSAALMARYYMQCHLDAVNRLAAMPCSDSVN